MEYEVLKRSHVKRNTLIAVLVIVLLLGIVIIKNKTNTLSNSSINKESITKEIDNNLIGAYIQEGEEYIQTDDIPSSGYEFNSEESYCKIRDIVQEDITLFYDMDTQTITVSPITKEGLKCYLYFDEKASGSEYILASPNAPTNHTTDWTNEGKGITYYYTGNPDNWVQFAGFYWRIIRINGDGSIRMIYQGTSANETGDGTRIGTSAFNSSSSNKTYVGLVYDGTNQHGYGTNSTIMNTLNNWYNGNLASYEEQYIDTGIGFCSDRNMASGYNFNSSDIIYYAAYDRINVGASLQCNSEDLLSKDNGKMPNSIGLLTSDEYVLAGSEDSYLDVGIDYWTMSPYYFENYGIAFVFVVYQGGGLIDYWGVDGIWGVRPVINLRADVQLDGSGTTTDPFRLVL